MAQGCPANVARFKVVSSFKVSLLGAVTLTRILLLPGSLSPEGLLAVLVAGLLTAAGFWRGWLYLQALRSLGGV
jgi:hypothetical protein